MHITTTTKALNAALATLKKAAPRPIDYATTIEAKRDAITLRATDGDVDVRCTIEGDVQKPGTVHLRYDDFAQAAKGTGPCDIADAKGVDGVVVTTNITTRVETVDPDHVRKPRRLTGGQVTTLIDVTALGSVAMAAGTDELRPILTGVHFDPDGTIVASDSYRMHMVSGPSIHTEPRLVPARALKAIAAKVKSGPVAVQAFDDVVRFAVDGAEWVVRVILGDFPNYRTMVPKQKSAVGTVVFPRPAFIDVLKSMNKMIGRNNGHVRLSQGETNLVVACHFDREGEPRSTTEVPGSTPFPIGMNPGFLAQLLEGMTTCNLYVAEPLKPAWATEVIEGLPHTRVIMPVRTIDY